jgi:hypothetical protein
MSEGKGAQPHVDLHYATASDMDALRRDQEAVDKFLNAAVDEVAHDIGGEGLAERISCIAASDRLLPYTDALQALEDTQIGAAELVIKRALVIQQDSHKRERARIEKLALRNSGSVVLRVFESFGRFAFTPRRRG